MKKLWVCLVRCLQLLRQAISNEVLFQGMQPKMIDSIIDVMYRVEVKPGQDIIKQGL